MSDLIRIGKISEIPPDKIKEFLVNGKPIAVANTEGKYMAFDGSCTHAQCSLAGGYLDGHTLTCYCHGGQFDIKTGEVLAQPPTIPLKVYKTKVEGENLLIEL